MTEDINLDIDPMLFFAAVIEDHVEMLDSLRAVGEFDPFAAAVGGQMAEITETEIAKAQEQLDQLIEDDKTWRTI